MTIRITYAVVPRGFNGPVTRISCGHAPSAEERQMLLVRYARYAATHFRGASWRARADGSLVVSVGQQMLATVEVEPEVTP